MQRQSEQQKTQIQEPQCLEEAFFRLSYLKKEVELQYMFKSSKSTIKGIRTNKFSLPKLSFLKTTKCSMEEEPLSPQSTFSSLSTKCSTSDTEGDKTFNFEDLDFKGEEEKIEIFKEKKISLKLNEKDSVKVKKVIKKSKVVLRKRRVNMKVKSGEIKRKRRVSLEAVERKGISCFDRKVLE